MTTKAYFYPQSTYTSIAAFAELFNDLTVRVYDKNNIIVGVKPVPLSLTPKEKIVAILTTNDVNDVDPQFDNYLPRMSINMTGLSFNSERMRGKNERRLLNIEYDLNNQKRTMQTDVQGVPYDISFEVMIWTKYMSDGLQLIEYLTPYFAPEQYVSFKERNFGLEHKSKVTLNSVSPNFVYELGETERRVITWSLGFTMETVMYKPMELTPEILCTNITIGGIPCKKTPVYGEKIVAYEPATENYESILTKTNKVSIYELDASEAYDKMVKYWRLANNVMDPPHYESCTSINCSATSIIRPEWDSSVIISPCTNPKMLPCISIDISGNISNYWQEQIVGPDNIIRIVSYLRVYDATGNTISGPDVVDNDTYPTSCVPIYDAPVVTVPITSVSPTSTPDIIPEPEPDIVVDTCETPPDYTTTG
jgi:hypothetical protein